MIALTLRTPDGSVEVDCPGRAGREVWRFNTLTPCACRACRGITATPFDRLLVAQAQLERLTIVTVDRPLEPYDVELRFAEE